MGRDAAGELAKEKLAALMFRARVTLRASQDDIARRSGVSKRTVRRWEAGQSTPLPSTLAELGGSLLTIEAPLGEELIRRGRDLAAQLGFPFTEPARPAPTPALVPAQTAPLAVPKQEALAVASRAVETKPIQMDHLVDAVVYAAVEVGQQLPQALRPILLAAFTRADELGLDIAEVRRSLERKRPGGRSR